MRFSFSLSLLRNWINCPVLFERTTISSAYLSSGIWCLLFINESKLSHHILYYRLHCLCKCLTYFLNEIILSPVLIIWYRKLYSLMFAAGYYICVMSCQGKIFIRHVWCKKLYCLSCSCQEIIYLSKFGARNYIVSHVCCSKLYCLLCHVWFRKLCLLQELYCLSCLIHRIILSLISGAENYSLPYLLQNSILSLMFAMGNYIVLNVFCTKLHYRLSLVQRIMFFF